MLINESEGDTDPNQTFSQDRWQLTLEEQRIERKEGADWRWIGDISEYWF